MNLTLVVASVVLTAGAMELAARVLRLESGFFLRPAAENCLRRDSLLSLSFRPDCVGILSDTVVRTNSLGFRGGELRDGHQRILAIGDSCTWGWKVAQEESYPAVMQRRFDDGMQANRYDVINAGVPGFTSYQGMLLLRERGLALHPDVVIAGFGFNDPTPYGDVERQLKWARVLMPVLRLDDFLLSVSHLWRWGRWRGEKYAQQVREPRVPVGAYGRNLKDIVGLARDHGAQVLLLSFFGEWEESEYRKALYVLAREEDVPLVQYKGAHQDLVHPTREGYEVLAEEVLIRLAYEGYIH